VNLNFKRAYTRALYRQVSFSQRAAFQNNGSWKEDDGIVIRILLKCKLEREEGREGGRERERERERESE